MAGSEPTKRNYFFLDNLRLENQGLLRTGDIFLCQVPQNKWK